MFCFLCSTYVANVYGGRLIKLHGVDLEVVPSSVDAAAALMMCSKMKKGIECTGRF